jgi:hypothetical protein
VLLKVSGANEILGAKLGANAYRLQATPGDVQPRSSLLNCPSGHIQPYPATVLTRLTSEGPVARTHLRPPTKVATFEPRTPTYELGFFSSHA